MKLFARGILLILTLSLSSYVVAEGKSKGGDDFRKAAKKYEAKSEKYDRKGMDEVSGLYARQAEIKRDAADLADEGRWDDIDWDEYHQNEGKIYELTKHKLKSHKKAKAKSKGGDDFRKAAKKYEAKSEKYDAKGMDEVSNLYGRQAEIKHSAAELADEGRWDDINWDEYYANEGKINELIGHKLKPHKKK